MPLELKKQNSAVFLWLHKLPLCHRYLDISSRKMLCHLFSFELCTRSNCLVLHMRTTLLSFLLWSYLGSCEESALGHPCLLPLLPTSMNGYLIHAILPLNISTFSLRCGAHQHCTWLSPFTIYGLFSNKYSSFQFNFSC